MVIRDQIWPPSMPAGLSRGIPKSRNFFNADNGLDSSMKFAAVITGGSGDRCEPLVCSSSSLLIAGRASGSGLITTAIAFSLSLTEEPPELDPRVSSNFGDDSFRSGCGEEMTSRDVSGRFTWITEAVRLLDGSKLARFREDRVTSRENAGKAVENPWQNPFCPSSRTTRLSATKSEPGRREIFSNLIFREMTSHTRSWPLLLSDDDEEGEEEAWWGGAPKCCWPLLNEKQQNLTIWGFYSSIFELIPQTERSPVILTKPPSVSSKHFFGKGINAKDSLTILFRIENVNFWQTLRTQSSASRCGNKNSTNVMLSTKVKKNNWIFGFSKIH